MDSVAPAFRFVSAAQMLERRAMAMALGQNYEVRGTLDGSDWTLGFTNFENGGTPLRVAQERYPGAKLWVIDLRNEIAT